jgi:hypothetical protein
MTAILKISPTLPREPFLHAISEVNEWRGRCLHSFSRAEAAVTQCLLALSKVSRPPEQIRLRHLVGQKFEDLTQALSAGGALEDSKARAAIMEFREYDSKRAMLCHSVCDVTLDMEGRWTVILRLVSFKNRDESRQSLIFEEKEATAFQDEIARKSQKLCSQLQRLTDSVSKSSQ